jgi:hypothetical protein
VHYTTIKIIKMTNITIIVLKQNLSIVMAIITTAIIMGCIDPLPFFIFDLLSSYKFRKDVLPKTTYH